MIFCVVVVVYFNIKVLKSFLKPCLTCILCLSCTYLYMYILIKHILINHVFLNLDPDKDSKPAIPARNY